jgi:hypothetical protein
MTFRCVDVVDGVASRARAQPQRVTATVAELGAGRVGVETEGAERSHDAIAVKW